MIKLGKMELLLPDEKFLKKWETSIIIIGPKSEGDENIGPYRDLSEFSEIHSGFYLQM